MPESSKVEARLDEVYAEALAAYMKDRFLSNESEVLRSALGKLLFSEGYLRFEGAALVAESPNSPTPPNTNPVKYSKSKGKRHSIKD